jgi:hypothetical protein
VIDVGMRENHPVQFLGAAVELLILGPRLFALPLEQTAVQQEPQIVGLDQVLAAGDFASCSEKCDLHPGLLSASSVGHRVLEVF